MTDYILDCILYCTPKKYTDSIKKQVRSNVRQYFSENLTAKQFQYPLCQRFLRAFFSIKTFVFFVGLYIIILCVPFSLFERALITVFSDFSFKSVQLTSISVDKNFLSNVMGYFITAQVGVLGVISIAIALIALITQREKSATDVKVYYHDSMAFKIVASSVALLAVLFAQLFLAGFNFKHLVFEVVLFFLNFIWLIFNLAGFTHFIFTTLGFVEQSKQGLLRKRYTANVVQPLDIAQRLRAELYRSVDNELEGGSISNRLKASFMIDRDTVRDVIELSSFFSKPTTLDDVRMKWVRWVLRKWKKRSLEMLNASKDVASSQSPILLFKRNIWTSVFFHKKIDWCRRYGGIPFTLREKLVLRWAFSFRRFNEKRNIEFPRSHQIFEELVNKVSVQMEQRTTVAFDSALREMVDYHRFLIVLNNPSMSGVSASNVAEMLRQAQTKLHDELIWCYIRLFDRAAEHIPSGSRYLRSLAWVPVQLLPHQDDPRYPHDIMDKILSIMLIMIDRLQNWIVTQKTFVASERKPSLSRCSLSRSDTKSYEDLLPDLIRPWENVLEEIIRLYSCDEPTKRSEFERWSEFQMTWPLLWKHLANTAHCLTLTVWNEDEFGAFLFCESLVRWPEKIAEQLVGHKDFPREYNISPDIISRDWRVATSRNKYLNSSQFDLTPDQLFANVFYGVHNNTIFLTAALLLFWAMHNKKMSKIGGRTAWNLLNQDVGERYSKHIDFSFQPLFFDMLSGEIYANSSKKNCHVNDLNALVKYLILMPENDVFPEPIHTPSTAHPRKELQTPMLALLAAKILHEDQKNDDVTVQRAEQLFGNESLLQDGCKLNQKIAQELQSILSLLENHEKSLLAAVSILIPDANAQEAVNRLHKVINNIEQLINSRGDI